MISDIYALMPVLARIALTAAIFLLLVCFLIFMEMSRSKNPRYTCNA